MNYIAIILDKTFAFYKLMSLFDPNNYLGNTYSFGGVGILVESMLCYLFLHERPQKQGYGFLFILL